MATENQQSMPATKQDKDGPSIEVKEEPVSVAGSKPTAKETPKPAVKEEPKPAATAAAAKEAPKPAAAKEEPKPAPAPAAAPAAVKEEPKPAAAPAAAKEAPKPAAAPAAAKEAPKPASAPKPPAASGPSTVDAVSRVGRAEAIVRRNVLWSLGAGVIPFPIFDVVAVGGVQMKMLAELSELYKVPFTEGLAKKLLGPLVSSVGGVALGTAVGYSFSKLIPGVGTALGVVSVPIMSGAFTHATGKVFIMHFEAGGTLLDFDPHKMRTYFRQEFEKAKRVVSEIHDEKAKTS